MREQPIFFGLNMAKRISTRCVHLEVILPIFGTRFYLSPVDRDDSAVLQWGIHSIPTLRVRLWLRLKRHGMQRREREPRRRSLGRVVPRQTNPSRLYEKPAQNLNFEARGLVSEISELNMMPSNFLAWTAGLTAYCTTDYLVHSSRMLQRQPSEI